MRALDRKLLRDLLQIKGQALAICLVLACGVAVFVMSLSTLESLRATQRRYYERYGFAHAFARLKRAPDSLLTRIAEIPGVAYVQSRIIVDVTVDVPGLTEPAAGRLISVPDYEPPQINRLHLRSGRYIEPGRREEVLASEGFAAANGLRPGDAVSAVINGRRQKLRIVGIVLSPEYVYQIREGQLLPDEKRFGVFWMSHTELSAAFDMQGAFNDLALALTPDAVEADVLDRLDHLTAEYGGLGAYGRADQVSHRYITNEIEELRSMAIFAPLVFLIVASFLLNIVMSRLIHTQREQVAALKAFGYTRREIGFHYLKFVLVLIILGVLLGTLAGARLGRDLTDMYTEFFHFPVFEYRVAPSVVLFALVLAGGAAILGTFAAVFQAVRLPPAEAMRPEPPAQFRPLFVERLGLKRFLSPAVRMILRQLERRPVRGLLSVLGIALALAVLVLGSYMGDAIDYIMELQFQVIQREDLSVVLVEPTSAAVLHEMQKLPGVQKCEPFRGVAARLRSEHYLRRVGIIGVLPHATLNRVVDVDGKEVDVPADGIVLSAKLAEILHLKRGDFLTVEILEGERPVRTVPVANVVADFAGLNAYMDIHAVNRLMGEGDLVSGAFLSADHRDLDSLYARLKETPRVASVNLKLAAAESLKKTIVENLLRMRMFNVGFACVIAFGVVYNSARIALAERSRELATLRVIGFTRAEISVVLLGELGLLTVLALPLGLALGYGFARLISQAYDTELFRIPLVITPPTYAFAVVVVLVAVLSSGLIVRRSLDHLDLVAVLKSKE